MGEAGGGVDEAVADDVEAVAAVERRGRCRGRWPRRRGRRRRTPAAPRRRGAWRRCRVPRSPSSTAMPRSWRSVGAGSTGPGVGRHVDTATSVAGRVADAEVHGGRVVVAVERDGRRGVVAAQHARGAARGSRRRDSVDDLHARSLAERRPSARRGRRSSPPRPGRGSRAARSCRRRAGCAATSPARRSCSSRSSPVSGSSSSSSARRRGERAGERDALGLAAAEPRDVAALEAGEPDEVQHRADPRRRSPLGPALHPQPERDVGGDVAVGEQLLVLEHHADAAAVRRQRAVTSRPSRCTVPASGGTRPATTRSSVLLPLPDGPSRATTSPSSTCSDTSREHRRARRSRRSRHATSSTRSSRSRPS